VIPASIVDGPIVSSYVPCSIVRVSPGDRHARPARIVSFALAPPDRAVAQELESLPDFETKYSVPKQWVANRMVKSGDANLTIGRSHRRP
jgi:hypothetical protein